MQGLLLPSGLLAVYTSTVEVSLAGKQMSQFGQDDANTSDWLSRMICYRQSATVRIHVVSVLMQSSSELYCTVYSLF